MAEAPANSALLFDIGSVYDQLMHWRGSGVFRDAPELFQSLTARPDRWLSRLAADSGADSTTGLRAYDHRVLILPRDYLADTSGHDGIFMDAVGVLVTRLGFRAVHASAATSLEIGVEVLRLLSAGGLPSRITILTSDPQVAGIGSGLRSMGVSTAVAAVMSLRSTRALNDLVDDVINLPSLVDEFDLDIEPGFLVTDADHRKSMVEKVLGILGPASGSGAVSTAQGPHQHMLDAIHSELKQDESLSASVPTMMNGLRAWLVDLQKDRESEVGALRDWHLSSDRLISTGWLAQVAGTVRSIARRGGTAEVETNAVRVPLSTIERELPALLELGRSDRLLGFPDVQSLLEAVAEAAGAKWVIADPRAVDYLIVRDLPSEPDGEFEADPVPRTDSVAPSEGNRPESDPDQVPTSSTADTSASPPIGDGPETDLRKVADEVMKRLSGAPGPMQLVVIANELPRAVPAAAPPNWLGYRTFLALLRAAEAQHPDARWIIETGISPGFIRLPHHPAPRPDATEAPTRGVPRIVSPNLRPAVSKVRKLAPDFPNASVEDLSKSIALVASTLAKAPTPQIHSRRLGKEVAKHAAASGLISGRNAYDALLWTVRVAGRHRGLTAVDTIGSGEEAAERGTTESIAGGEVYLSPSNGPNAMTVAALRILCDGPNETDPPGGTVWLIRLIADTIRRGLHDRGLSDESDDVIEELLGPMTASEPDESTGPIVLAPATLSSVRAAFERFRNDQSDLFGDEQIRLLKRLRTDLIKDRLRYLSKPEVPKDPSMTSTDIRKFLNERLAGGSERRIRIDEAFDDFAVQHGPIDRSSFLALLTDVVEEQRRESRLDGLPWHLSLNFPPGTITVGDPSRTDQQEEQRKLHALNSSFTFVRDYLVAEGMAVGWAEAVWVMSNPD